MGDSFRQTIADTFSNAKMDETIMLSGHLAQTLKRCQASEGEYLIVAQDTTFYNYSGHQAMEGLGVLQENIKGIIQHNSLVINESGISLGLLHQQYWSRESSRSFEGVESKKWFNALDSVNTHLGNSSKKVVLVQDREADIFDFFKAKREASVELIVRVFQPRNLEIVSDSGYKHQHILDGITATCKLSQVSENIKSLGTTQTRISRDNKEVNLTLDIKASKVNILPDKTKKGNLLKTMGLSLVIAEEIAAVDKDGKDVFDAKDKAIWYLLTSLPVESFEDAKRVIKFYGLRWMIERFHFTMKTGALNVEKLQFDDIDTTINALTFYSVVGWRLLAITHLIRLEQDYDANTCFTETEVILLSKLSKKTISTVKQAALALTKIVGFAPSKKQPMPGIKVLAQAMERFHYIKIGAGISG